MPNASYTIKFGETIFDVAIKLYGDVSYASKLLAENSSVLEDLNSETEGITVVYDTSFKSTVREPLIVNATVQINLGQTYRPCQNQTIFDIALMLAGDLESIVNVVVNSTLNNINTEVKQSDSFTYFKKKSGLLDLIERNKYVFATATPIEGLPGREFNTAFDRLSFD